MNFKIKIIIALLITIIIITMNTVVILNSVRAANLEQITQVDLHYGGMCEQLLKYKGVIVKTTYVEYYGDNGINYPAYCMDKKLSGVSDELEYTVSTTTRINDIGLWRTVINGYPYKSLEELGVANIDEAFTATKQAVYCYLYENTPDDYEAIGEAGERTLNALKKIVSDSQNSTETMHTNNAQINAENEKWIDDEKDNKYISKIYSVKSNANFENYEIAIKGTLPKESKITNLDGTETTKFSRDDKFKIMLLKEYLDEDGSFTLNLKTELKTKPVLYGASPNADWQNYALTAYMFEDASNEYIDTYEKIEKPKEPEIQKTPEIPKTAENPKIQKEKPEEVKILPITGM